jgi:murein DD-endopeptidase MepM/ murein hydrolase activator NlpD
MSEADLLTPAHAKKRGSRRRWLIVAGLVALPVLALAAIHFTIDHLADLNLQEALAEADRLDPGWRLDDLEASRADYPDEENSALQVQAVRRLIPGNWASKEEFYRLFTDLPKQHQLDAAALVALREEMAKVPAAVAEARKLADMPHGRFPNLDPSDWLSPPFMADAQGARSVAYLLEWDVRLLSQEGDADGALRSIQAILNTSRAVGDDPRDYAQLVRMALRNVTTGNLERVLAQGEPSPPALAAFQQLLERDEQENLLLHNMRGERAGYNQLAEAVQKGTVSTSKLVAEAGEGANLGQGEAMKAALLLYLPGNVKNQRATLVRSLTKAAEAAKLPAEQQRGQLDQIKAEVSGQGMLVGWRLLWVIKEMEANLRTLALMRCALVAVSVERYRRGHGNWPAALDVLVADGLLKQVPTDPYDGAPLRYQVRDDRVVIYSVARDLEDNGGTFDGRSGMTKGTDLGFTLWDVSHRRLLPLPAAEPPPGEPEAGSSPPPATKEPRP